MLFLAEAFTRPARMFGLGRLGYTQSYTYFTWRTGKQELTEFALMHAERADECRPNLFVNTPDILHESLQTGGPSMFAIRATLAATMSPTYGVYAGFELYEWEPVKPGSEEYRNSEKYALRPRDFAGALNEGRSLEPYLTRLNEIRRAHPALQQLRDIHFHHTDNDQVIAYSKTDVKTGDTVLVVCTLDPDERPDGQPRPRHAVAGGRLERHPRRARRDQRGDLPLGPVRVRAAGAVARRRAHPPRRAVADRSAVSMPRWHSSSPSSPKTDGGEPP